LGVPLTMSSGTSSSVGGTSTPNHVIFGIENSGVLGI
jgi:hypothetical protein